MLNRYRSVVPGALRREKGSILLEVLIAFVVLAGGLLVMFRFHNTTVDATATAKIRAEATALAQAKLEQVRAYLGSVDYLQLMQAGNGLNDAGLADYSGTDFAANFTREWTVDTDPYSGVIGEPWEISVVVKWTDRNNQEQQVMLVSSVADIDPSSGATELAYAVAGGGDPIDGWRPEDPTQVGTGYGGGKVTIKYKGDDGNEYDSVADATVAGTVVNSFDLYFTGTIESIDGGALLDVQLDGGPNVGVETCLVDPNITDAAVAFDPTLYDPGTNSPTYTDHFGLVHPGAWVDDSDPAVIVPDPYLYSCKIPGISISDTWQGTITYIGEQGVPGSPDDEVCIPNEGTTTLSFSAGSPETLQLGIVLVDKKNLCNAFN